MTVPHKAILFAGAGGFALVLALGAAVMFPAKFLGAGQAARL